MFFKKLLGSFGLDTVHYLLVEGWRGADEKIPSCSKKTSPTSHSYYVHKSYISRLPFLDFRLPISSPISSSLPFLTNIIKHDSLLTSTVGIQYIPTLKRPYARNPVMLYARKSKFNPTTLQTRS